MMLGVDNVGVGASDMDAARRFYGDLGFTEVAFDYTGPLPGMERVAGRSVAEARVVMLRAANPTALGLGAIRLVQTLDEPVPVMPLGLAWGERGICEVCVHVRNQPELYRWLVEERGATSLMEPNVTETTPHGSRASLSYVADADGGKVELIEWLDLAGGWPDPHGPHGLNHVAFGVADIERSRDFYLSLGFTGMLFESNDHYPPMDPWFSGPAPRQHMMLLTNPYGAALEPVQHDPPSPDMRGEWGHAGPMDFAVGVRNIDEAVRPLSASGIEFLCAPQTIEVGSGTWRYAYLADPDGLYVCLTEARY